LMVDGGGAGGRVVVQADKKVIVAGYANEPAGTRSDNDMVAVRFTAAGKPDTAFAGDGSAHVDLSAEGDDRAFGIALAADVNDVTVKEGNSGTVAATFAITLSAASPTPVTVKYATAPGTATATDFTAASGTVSFAAGQTSKTVTVLVKGDTVKEPNEQFSLK